MAYAQALQALGDPTRRSVLEELRDGPRAVGEIAARLPVSRPAVSQHLRVLKEAGLVTERQNGTRRLYRVEPDGLAELREYLEGFWEEALANFKAAAEKEEGRTRERVGRGARVRGRKPRAVHLAPGPRHRRRADRDRGDVHGRQGRHDRRPRAQRLGQPLG